MKDQGRQRVAMYVARRFSVNSKSNNEIEVEIKKHEGLTHRIDAIEQMDVDLKKEQEIEDDSEGLMS